MEREFKTGTIRLIVGLGNPGPEYENTYHNAGFRALAEAAGTDFRRPPGKIFSFARTKDLVFMRPETFMNESGAALREALRYFAAARVSPPHILVIHDDSDLPLGTWKLQFGRGPAGHKGVASLIAALGTSGFWRARIGIRPEEKAGLRYAVAGSRLGVASGEARVGHAKAGEFVLKRITRADARALESVFKEITEILSPGS